MKFSLVKVRPCLRGVVRGAWLCTLSSMLSVALSVPLAARAQVSPSAADEVPLVPLDTASSGPAPQASADEARAAQQATSPERAQLAQLTRQLLSLEQQTLQLEAERARIRTSGVRIGKIVSWAASAVLLFTAFSYWGSAASIQEAVDDGRDDKAYDLSGNQQVTRHDEDLARGIARGLAIGSLVPIGLGVFCTMLQLKREKQRRALTNSLEDVALRRRGLIRRLGGELGVSASNASFQLRVSF